MFSFVFGINEEIHYRICNRWSPPRPLWLFICIKNNNNNSNCCVRQWVNSSLLIFLPLFTVINMNVKCKQIWMVDNNSQPVCLFIFFRSTSAINCGGLIVSPYRASHSQSALAFVPRLCFLIMVSIHFIYSFVAARSLDDECATQWMKTGDGREQREQCHLRFGIMQNERKASMIVECNVNLFVSSTKKKYNSLLFDSIKWKNDARQKKMWKVKTNQQTCK